MIRVNGLTFTYVGADKPAVLDLHFEIAQGEIFGFLGPSGAGKSTTQKILNGLLQGYAGQVTVMGRELREWGSDYYERIGVSFELPNHYLKLTAVENLSYYRALYRPPTRSPTELLEEVGLADSRHLLVSQFSKGMKNRLSLARALIHNPELLFLDEPTAGLDPVNARRIRAIIEAQKEEGKTIFLTTHDMHVASQLCDRVAFIVDGRIRLIGVPDQLRLTYGRPEVVITYQEDGRLSQQTFPLSELAHHPKFLSLLEQQRVKTIHTQEATLEDVFIAVTGRSLA